MQREVIKWLQSLDLTYPVRCPRRDMANGFAAAEIISRYADTNCIAMHGISTGVSSQSKRDNWRQVLRALQRLRCTTITGSLVEATLQARPNAAQAVLENLYEFFTLRTLHVRMMDTGGSSTVAVKPNDADNFARFLETVGEVPPGATTDDVQHSPSDAGYTVGPAAVQEQFALTKNMEVASWANTAKKPSYARPTAAVLMHGANCDHKVISLNREKYEEDVQQVRNRNVQIMEQHELLQRMKRDEHGKRKEARMMRVRGEEGGQVPLTSLLRGRAAYLTSQQKSEGPRSAALATVEANSCATGEGTIPCPVEAKKIQVNALSETLLTALGVNGAILRGSERAGEKSVELFEKCGYNTRKAFTSLLRDVLSANSDLHTVVELGGINGEGNIMDDLFTAFITYRDALSMQTLKACWTVLNQNVAGVATAVDARPEEYQSILQALGFLFTLDSAQVALLHVSSFTTDCDTDGIDTASLCLSTTRSSAVLQKISTRRHRSQSVGQALLRCASDDQEGPEKSHTPQQAVLCDRHAYYVASAFVFLGKIGEAIAIRSPLTAVHVLTTFFLPAAAAALVPFGSAAMLEAVARVMACTLCPHREETGKSATSTPTSAGSDVLRSQEENILQFLLDVLHPMVVGKWGSCPTRGERSHHPMMRCYKQYYVLLYHFFTHSRCIINNFGANSACHGSVSPFLRFVSDTASTCISSENVQIRSVGVAMMTQLVQWESWESVVEAFTGTGQPLLLCERGDHGSVCPRAAGNWELRILLLELYMLVARKRAALQATEKDLGVVTPRENNENGFVPLSQRVATALPLDTLETATISCLRTFVRSPPLHRQLALTIVGRHLLPDVQPRVAVAWLECLQSTEDEEFFSRLLPYNNTAVNEVSPIREYRGWEESSRHSIGLCSERLSMPMKAHLRQHGRRDTRPRTNRQSTESTVAIGGLRTVSDADVSADRGDHFIPYPAASSHKQCPPTQQMSTMRLLSGKVEPAYAVSPLSQVWDPFGVVHAVVQRQGTLSEDRSLAVVATALRNSQGTSVRLLQLQNDLTLAIAHCTTPSNSSLDGEVAGHEEQHAVLSMQDMVHMDMRNIIAGISLTRTTDSGPEACVSPKKGKTDIANGGRLLQERHLSHCCEDGDEENEGLLKAFWLSTLLRLLPAIHRALPNGDDGQMNMKTRAELSSVDILLMLFTKYGKEAPTQEMANESTDALQRALAWADDMACVISAAP